MQGHRLQLQMAAVALFPTCQVGVHGAMGQLKRLVLQMGTAQVAAWPMFEAETGVQPMADQAQDWGITVVLHALQVAWSCVDWPHAAQGKRPGWVLLLHKAQPWTGSVVLAA